ncbi:hypothetical protein AUJ61_03350 [Candidatus Pacearchaeota archaeon CG1_02_30_18]|nr:MgtC/SapB family protein [Candidatus Pacearchaeota archaeon]OIO39831.1 MAG: hypothetical protein AUJ61_03350 [Candidatus Pacearchaeota archaeon CG1_02_30_18]PIN71336.1 MAG: hypothetical protein COV77_02535 [Candidatus Pacearchaeota archaeon CG11_big_fil_rev_8_21_14_0_20_30_13]PJA71057.1 MAG: hypothetical protein CO153_03605 [Candidatus Pacearchaeota archaeon CG_4_9_14_3_um_filter_30_11]
METWIILLRMLLTFIPALIFGFQRQRSHKLIGFGTFTFVAVGACGLAITAVNLGMGNPLPLLGSIVTGIGFLGAGALIRTTDKIFGFTTAASIWVFSIFGLLIGVGEYFIGGMTYLFVWIIILIDGFLEKNGVGSYHKKLFFEIKEKKSKEFNEFLKKFGKVKMISIEINRKEKVEKYQYIVECSGRRLRELIIILNNLNWVISYKIE